MACEIKGQRSFVKNVEYRISSSGKENLFHLVGGEKKVYFNFGFKTTGTMRTVYQLYKLKDRRKSYNRSSSFNASMQTKTKRNLWFSYYDSVGP